MKRVSILIPALLIALALGFVSCKKDANNTSGNSTLGIKIQALNKGYSLPVNNDGTKSASAVMASVLWDTARMTVSSVKYEAELNSLVSHHDSIKISYEWRGPQDINLFDTNISIGNFILQPGYYDQVEINVQGLKHDAGNKPVFYLHGLYTMNDGTVLPIMVKVNETVNFKTEQDSVNVSASEISDFTSTIQLQLDKLMADVLPAALDGATVTDGVIIISENSNNELYRIIMRNLGRNHHCEHHHHHGNGHG